MSQENQAAEPQSHSYLQNILAGLTVSFVAISLGAAFGVMSGRGAFAGIISAGLIAFVTSLLGGTRIQCSGPTAPMTAVTATVVAMAMTELPTVLPGVNADHFINIVLLLTGAILILMAVLRMGRFIKVVPAVVVSGFMNGIAVLIWVGELKSLFGWGKTGLTGSLGLNVAIALITLILLFSMPPLIRKGGATLSSFLPVTLVTIILMSSTVFVLSLNIEMVHLGAGLHSASQLLDMIKTQIPTSFSMDLISVALPFALSLSLLAYLDTLLTSLVVDQKMIDIFNKEEKTAQNKELFAQGLANALVAFVGGIPGAQATIRSVLILKENATMRLAGILTGVFVLVEMVLFQDLVSFIPKAVFAGLLIKVGYDVMDWNPILVWFRELKTKPSVRIVPHLDMLFIAGTTAVTVVWNLNAAVIGFTVLYYMMKKIKPQTEDLDSSVSHPFGEPVID
jgi:SulP family sulfate permease